MTTAEIIAKFPGYATMDPNAVQADFAATGGAGKTGGSTSSSGSGGQTLNPTSVNTTNVNDYLKMYQDMLFGSSTDTSSPEVKTSYTADELKQALISKGGYNETDAANAANNAGGRADALAKEFLGVGATPDAAAGGTGTGNPLYQNIKSMLEPNTPYPTAINRVQEFTQLREQQGLGDLETNLNDLKAQQKAEYAQLQTNKAAEFGKPVAMNVIAGRVSEQERTATERLDAIQRQISYVSDQLTTGYNLINTIMGFENLDYQDAVTKYNTEFQKNLSTIQIVQGIAKDTVTIAQQQQQQATANLQIYANAISSGNLDPSTLSSDQKTQLAKLEVQSGLPVGFISSLQMSTKDKIISTSTSNGVTSVVMADAQGNLTIKKVGTPTSSTPANTQALKDLKADVSGGITLDAAIKKYGTLSPDLVYSTYNEGSPYGKAKESAADLKTKYNITGTQNLKSTITNTDINKAVQIAITNGASDDEIQQIKDNPDQYVNDILAIYGDTNSAFK
jgi:hypothetical protein